jgi:hypothetical protein
MMTVGQVARAFQYSKHTRDERGRRLFRVEDVLAYAGAASIRLAPGAIPGPTGPTSPATVASTVVATVAPNLLLEGGHPGGPADPSIAPGPTADGTNQALAQGQHVTPVGGPFANRMTGATLDQMMRLLAIDDLNANAALARIVALWNREIDYDTAIKLGVSGRARAGRALCIACAEHSKRPLWASVAAFEFGRSEVTFPSLYGKAGGRSAVPCSCGAVPAPQSAACPVCQGDGVTPLWVHNALHRGVAVDDVREPQYWRPFPCPGCAGWGRTVLPTEDVEVSSACAR